MTSSKLEPMAFCFYLVLYHLRYVRKQKRNKDRKKDGKEGRVDEGRRERKKMKGRKVG